MKKLQIKFIIVIVSMVIAVLFFLRKSDESYIEIAQTEYRDAKFQEILDIRFKLRHPQSNIQDLKNYNRALFCVWLSNTNLFNEFKDLKQFNNTEQGESFIELIEAGDPLDIKRFGELELKTDSAYISILNNHQNSSYRLELLRNLNSPKRKFSSYENEVINYSLNMKKFLSSNHKGTDKIPTPNNPLDIEGE